ncbi:nuclear transport factor 2 family protein [Rhodococcus sp. 3Y1]
MDSSDRVALTDLAARYAQAVDRRNTTALAALFTDDVAFVLPPALNGTGAPTEIRGTPSSAVRWSMPSHICTRPGTSSSSRSSTSTAPPPHTVRLTAPLTTSIRGARATGTTGSRSVTRTASKGRRHLAVLAS